MAMDIQTLQTSCSSLPPELWLNIVESLPRDTARTCLSINKLFHDIALPIVFARIVLRFGAFEVNYYRATILSRNRDEVRMLEENEQRYAQELLDRMASDASFAAIVRTLQVQASARSLVSAEESGREAGAMVVTNWTDRLLTAIPLLNRLRSFSWHCSYPSPEAVVRRLAESCPLLECFEAPISCINKIPFHHLKNVKTIRTTWTEESTPEDIHRMDPGLLLISLYKTLRKPLFNSGGVPHCLLHTITDLELFFYDHIPEDLEKMLHSARQLESLALMPFELADSEQQERMHRALSIIPRDLTHLHSLRIGRGYALFEDSQLDMLCRFIMSRPRLRRMIILSTLYATDSRPFFHAMMTLGKLEVLGLVLECEDLLVSEWINLLLAHVPSCLTALALDIRGGYANKDTFSTLWSCLPNLQFIFVRLSYGPAILTPNQFIRGASNKLRIVCFQGRFYDVQRTTNGVRVVLPPWPSRKVRFRTVEDFGCADIEWLMRHYFFHDYIPAKW